MSKSACKTELEQAAKRFKGTEQVEGMPDLKRTGALSELRVRVKDLREFERRQDVAVPEIAQDGV